PLRDRDRRVRTARRAGSDLRSALARGLPHGMGSAAAAHADLRHLRAGEAVHRLRRARRGRPAGAGAALRHEEANPMGGIGRERLHRHALLGIRFWDLAAAGSSVDGLEVDVFPRARPRVRTRAWANRSGVYVAQDLPGMRELEFADPDPWSAALRPYRVE